jgi:hypothetical protein
MKLIVRSVVIDWQDQTMEIKATSGEAHTIPLDTTITVTMLGHPEREEKTFPAARELDPFIMRGYIIEEISFDDRHPF